MRFALEVGLGVPVRMRELTAKSQTITTRTCSQEQIGVECVMAAVAAGVARLRAVLLQLRLRLQEVVVTLELGSARTCRTVLFCQPASTI